MIIRRSFALFIFSFCIVDASQRAFASNWDLPEPVTSDIDYQADQTVFWSFGHWETGLGVGSAFPLNHDDFNKVARPFVAGGVDILYFPQNMIGVGFVGDVVPFDTKDLGSGLTIKPFMADFMFALKFVMLPQELVQPYIITAFGGDYYYEAFKLNGKTVSSDSSVRGAASAGLGLQSPLTDSFLLGVEGRWHHFMIDAEKFGPDYLEAASVMLRMSWRY